MRQLHVAAFCALSWLGAASIAHADVQITLQDGRVTVVAHDATLRQILAEWARVGQTKIVNAERVPGGTMTLQLQNVPEEQALDILLRSLSGYVAAPRPMPVSNLSRFDRILVMPTSAPATAPNSRPASPAQPFSSQSPTSFPMPAPPAQMEDDQEGVPNRAPAFTTFPPPQVGSPQQQNGATSVPGLVAPAQSPLVLPQPNGAPQQTNPGGTMPAGGVTVPGMIVPAPPQPKRPGGI